MKVITGGKELIGSETFIALGEGETEISLDDGSESIRFIFSFVESDNEREADIESEVVDNKTLKLRLTK